MNQDALRILAKELTRGAIQSLNADACRSGLRKLHSDRPSRCFAETLGMQKTNVSRAVSRYWMLG